MEEQKVYIVTKGSYSDYHICRVFFDENLAKEYCKSISDDSFDGEAVVEKYEIGKDNKSWKLGWRVDRNINRGERKDLKKDEVYWGSNCLEELDESEDGYYYSSDSFNVKNNVFFTDGYGRWVFYLEAPNKEAALKIANERYMKVQTEQDLTHRFELNTYYNYNNFEEVK